MFNQDSYILLINKLLSSNYKFVFFEDFNRNIKGQIILRHDVDQDCSYALELAKIENSLGIKSTYFFLIRNDSYNLFSERNSVSVKKIKSLGHSISLHFDPLVYKNPREGLLLEKNMFENFFNEKVNMVSLHRPPKDYIGSEYKKALDFPNTYEDIYFKNIHYCSDSRGAFRYGYPTNSMAFKKKLNIQLLIHPIWWIAKGGNPFDKIDSYRILKQSLIEKNLKENLDFYEKNYENISD